MPLLMALCVVVGILIGTFYANHLSGNRLSIINSSGNKLNSLLQIVNDQYVDTVNMEDMVEGAGPSLSLYCCKGCADSQRRPSRFILWCGH